MTDFSKLLQTCYL